MKALTMGILSGDESVENDDKYQSPHSRKIWSQKWHIFLMLWSLALSTGKVH